MIVWLRLAGVVLSLFNKLMEAAERKQLRTDGANEHALKELQELTARIAHVQTKHIHMDTREHDRLRIKYTAADH